MKINVLVFAQLREHFGASRWQTEFPTSGTLQDLQQLMINACPQAESVILASRFAVNQQYIQGLEHSLQTGDEVALIPPVSGG